MLRRFAFAALAFSVRLAVAAEAPVPDFVPPATNAVLGFHVRGVIDSGLIQDLIQNLGVETFKSAGAKWTSTSPVPGIDPLKDVDDIVLASTLGSDHPPSLVICRGRFRVDEMGKGAEPYHGIPMQVKDGNAIALLDAGTVLAGEVKDVRAAIDRREAHATGLEAALAQRAGELSERYAIWGVGTLPPGYHPPSGTPDGLGSMDRFDFGIALSQGLNLAATVHVQAPEDAQKLAAVLMFVQMMATSQPSTSGAKFETHAENGTLSLSVSMTEEVLKKAFEQQRAAIAQGIAQSAAKPSVSAKPPAPAKPPVSNEVKIFPNDYPDSTQVTLPGKR